MLEIFSSLSASTLVFACAIALLAGIVKGMVGFAMPMILISGLSSVIEPELALAGLILPTLVTNGMQALRQGPRAAFDSMRRFKAFLLVAFVMLVVSAQLVAIVSQTVLLLMIGGPIVLFALIQLAGWQLTLPSASRRWELGIGALAGFIGGFSGVWGPPTVAYLTALQTEKREQMRIQGVIYGLGAVGLTLAHIGSGVFNPRTAVLSMALVPAAVVGMWIGGFFHDSIDQRVFRRATLVVLLVAGLNLIRRGLA